MKSSGWVEFNSEGVQKPIQKKKVFEYKNDNQRSYGTYNEAAAESSAEMDSYSVVPITMPEKSERLFNAPQRKSKLKRSYNQSAVSKFSDQQIDSSKMIQDPVNDTIDYGFNQEYQVEQVDFTQKREQMSQEAEKDEPAEEEEEIQRSYH